VQLLHSPKTIIPDKDTRAATISTKPNQLLAEYCLHNNGDGYAWNMCDATATPLFPRLWHDRIFLIRSHLAHEWTGPGADGVVRYIP
jgi:hypothetical protein